MPDPFRDNRPAWPDEPHWYDHHLVFWGGLVLFAALMSGCFVLLVEHKQWFYSGLTWVMRDGIAWWSCHERGRTVAKGNGPL